ncbi:hypothetical protein Noda2021_12150 [Candidatus Dependentiae bacterium Noda2021]|nr:hypothetical protein Noda2021_12150 [Candidatus Dependentiae bacterium Noda2021]
MKIVLLIFCFGFMCHSMEHKIIVPQTNDLQKKYQYWDPLEYPDYVTPAHETVTVFLQALMNKHLYFESSTQQFVLTEGHRFLSPTSTKNFLDAYQGKIAIHLDEAELILRALDICFIEKRPINFLEDKTPIDYSRTILEYSEFSEYYDIKSTKKYEEIKNIRSELKNSILKKNSEKIAQLLKCNYQLNKAILWKNEASPKNNKKHCQTL